MFDGHDDFFFKRQILHPWSEQKWKTYCLDTGCACDQNESRVWHKTSHYFNLEIVIHQSIPAEPSWNWLACVASVTVENVRTRAKKKKKRWRGKGREEEETLARKPHDFEKLRSPTNAAFDWCGAGSVDYLALETSIKPGMFRLRCVADLIRSDLWSQIANALVWYLFESCLCEGLSGLSPFDQKYNWTSSSGD